MVKNFMDLSDRVAVVIGGTSGLGRTIALGLAEAGAVVVSSGRRQELVEEVSCSNPGPWTRYVESERKCFGPQIDRRSARCRGRALRSSGRAGECRRKDQADAHEGTIRAGMAGYSGHEFNRHAPLLPILLRIVASRPARAHHQHRLAEFIRCSQRSGRLCRVQIRRLIA